MIDHIKTIYDLISEKLNDVIPELSPKRRGGKYYLTCPECHEETAYYYADNKFIFCNRKNNCGLGQGRGVSLWDYLAGRDGWKDNREALKGMAAFAGYNLPELTPEHTEKIDKAQRNARLNEEVFLLFRSWFERPEAAPCREYLKGRGWSESELNDIKDIGFFDKKTLEAEAAAGSIPGEILERIRDTGRLGWADNYDLVIPWRAANGDIEAFQFRATDDKTDPKYKFTPGQRSHILFKYHEARRSRSDAVYITEGVIDALRLVNGGINAVALGGVALNEKHIKLLQAANIRHAVLMLDADTAGASGTEKVIDLLVRTGINPTVVEMPDGVKDPDEFLRKGGTVEQLKALPRVSWLKWKAAGHMKGYEDADIIGQKNRLDKVISDVGLAKFHGLDYIETNKYLGDFGLDIDFFSEEVKAKEKQAAEQAAAEAKRERDEKFKGGLKELYEAAESGATPESLVQSIDNLKAAARPKAAVKDIITWLDEEYALALETKHGSILGYGLSQRFEKTRNISSGIQPGLYLVGAGPNVGKTAFTMNLAIDLIETNPEIQVLIYTLDDNRKTIKNRLVGIISRVPMNDAAALLGAPKDISMRVYEAYEALKKWIRAGRLNIKDISEIEHISDIEADLITAQSESRPAVVFIDALLNLEVDSEINDQRAVNIARANQIKKVVTDFNMPLFCTVEVKKNLGPNDTPTLSDILETGKFGYNANMVYMLQEDKSGNNNEQAETPENIKVKLHCVKNKFGAFKKFISLMFEPRTSFIEEDDF